MSESTSDQKTPRTSPARPKEDAPLYHEYGILEQFNLPPKTVRYIRAHQRMLWSIFAGLVVLALLFAGIDAWREHGLNKAAAALDQALRPGKDQRARLEEVMRNYASSPSALWAEVALAQLDESEGKIPAAIQRYQSVLAGLPKQLAGPSAGQMEPLVLGKLAGLEEQQKNWGGALGYWRRLGNVEGFAADAAIGIGRLKEAQGKKEEALAEYKKFVQITAVSSADVGEDPRRQMILAHIEVMQAKPGKPAQPDKADKPPAKPAAQPAPPKKAEAPPAQPAAAPKETPAKPAAQPAAPATPKAEQAPPAQPAAAPKETPAKPAAAPATPKTEQAPAQPAPAQPQDKP